MPEWMRDHPAQQQREQKAAREAQRRERLRAARAKLAQGRGAFGARVQAGVCSQF